MFNRYLDGLRYYHFIRNGYRIYVDIISIYVANMNINYWSVRSYSKRGAEEVTGVDGRYSYLASYRFNFIY